MDDGQPTFLTVENHVFVPEPIVPVLDTAKSAEILRKLQPDSDLRAYTYVMHGIWESVWDHENSHIDPHFKTSAAPVGVMVAVGPGEPFYATQRTFKRT